MGNIRLRDIVDLADRIAEYPENHTGESFGEFNQAGRKGLEEQELSGYTKEDMKELLQALIVRLARKDREYGELYNKLRDLQKS